MRDAGREVSLSGAMPAASSAALASMLLGTVDLTDAGGRSRRASCDFRRPSTRLILGPGNAAMRHFELLSRIEAAHVLGISEDAGSKRYLRTRN